MYKEENIKKKKIPIKNKKKNFSLEKRRSSLLKGIELFHNFSSRNLQKSKNLTNINFEKRKSANSFHKDNLNEKKEIENLHKIIKNKFSISNLKENNSNFSNINEENSFDKSKNSIENFNYWPNF